MSTILLVDNTKLITEIVGEQLSDNTEFGGYQVIKVDTYNEAIEHLQHSDFDYLITAYYLDQGHYGTTLIQQCERPSLLISHDDVEYKADAVGAGFINKNRGFLNRRIHDWIIRQPRSVTLN